MLIGRICSRAGIRGWGQGRGQGRGFNCLVILGLFVCNLDQ